LSRQHDRSDLTPEVRIRMAEDDLDRVDQRFEQAEIALKHAKSNLDYALKGLDTKYETRTDRLEQKVERIGADAEEEIAGNRKVLVGVLVSTLAVAITIVAQVLIMRGGS
jgi:hypothetical protein